MKPGGNDREVMPQRYGIETLNAVAVETAGICLAVGS